MQTMLKAVCVLAITAIHVAAQQSAETLDFLAGLPDFQNIRRMLPEYLDRIGLELLDERGRAVANLRTGSDVAARRAYVRERMLRAIGGLPERTPLNARVVGVIERDGYRVEKIIFESQPRFYVAANLYLPTSGRPPYPAVLFPLGHERGGKAYPVWQQILVTLARRGYVALTWDPLGQGERSQFYDPEVRESKLGANRSTTEHSMIGAQCLLVGDNVARYTIWDGIRALDYLISRKEVDPARVAISGNSGGGTHTAYIAALDDRLAVAAPSCYLTSWRRLLRTIGPQDAEQNFPPSLADGLDHGDFVVAFAPKPYLVLSAIRDFFSISGARETFAEARRVYASLGEEQKIAMVEGDDGHGYSRPRRLAAYDWFSRWLKGEPDTAAEVDVQPESEQALNCTESGQVAVTMAGGETVFSLNVKRYEQVRRPRGTAAEVLRYARELSGFQPPTGPLNITRYGEIRRNGYRIEKLTYESEPGIIVPALLAIPDGATRAPAVIYVNGRGKAAAGDIEQLVRSHQVVLALDPRGIGETSTAGPQDGQRYSGYFGDYASAMKAMLIGRSLAGMRAADIVRGIELLAGRPEVDAARISGFGRGSAAVPLLYAAAFDTRIRQLALEEMLVSYEAVATNRIHRDAMESVVRRALKFYDLPDLVAAMAPRSVWVVNAADQVGYRAPLGEVRKLYSRAGPAIRVVERSEAQPLGEFYRDWIKQ